MSPNPSPTSPTTRISVEYESDIAGAAEALLVLLRPNSPTKPGTDGTVSPGVRR